MQIQTSYLHPHVVLFLLYSGMNHSALNINHDAISLAVFPTLFVIKYIIIHTELLVAKIKSCIPHVL